MVSLHFAKLQNSFKSLSTAASVRGLFVFLRDGAFPLAFHSTPALKKEKKKKPLKQNIICRIIRPTAHSVTMKYHLTFLERRL
jgi:hypothetical protein